MKYIVLIYFLFTGIGAFTQAPEYNSYASTSRCNNKIRISGETNVNDFHLEQKIPEELFCGPGDSNWFKASNENYYVINIPARMFSANNQFVYKDFLDLINASEFPYIQIILDEKDLSRFHQERGFVKPEIRILLAGYSKTYRVNCIISDCRYGEKTIKGRKEIKLTDFKLDPPVKSFGLIKVKNELNINFEFKLPSQNLSSN